MPRSSTWVEHRKSPEGDRAMLVGGASTRKISSSLGMKGEKIHIVGLQRRQLNPLQSRAYRLCS